MATGTNAIATEKEAAKISGSELINEGNRGCTKNTALKYNCTVAGTYASNQLVKYSSLSKTGGTGGTGGGVSSDEVGRPSIQPPVRIYSINNTVLERNIGNNYPHHWLDSTQGPVVLDTYITDGSLTSNEEYDYWTYKGLTPFCPVKLNSKHIQIILLAEQQNNINFCIYGGVADDKRHGSYSGTIPREYNGHFMSWNPGYIEDPNGVVSYVSTIRFIDSNDNSLIVFNAYLYNFGLLIHTPYTIDFWSEDSSGIVTRIDFVTNDDGNRPRTDHSEYLNYTFGSIQAFDISAIQNSSDLVHHIDSIKLLSQRNARLIDKMSGNILGDVVYYDTFSNYNCQNYVLGLQPQDIYLTLPGYKIDETFNEFRYFDDERDLGFRVSFTIEFGTKDYANLTTSQLINTILTNTIINLGYTHDTILGIYIYDDVQSIYDAAEEKKGFNLHDYKNICVNDLNINPINITNPAQNIYQFDVDLLYYVIDHLVGSRYLNLVMEDVECRIVGNLQYLNRVYAFGFDILSNFNSDNITSIDELIGGEYGLGLYTWYSDARYDSSKNYPTNPEFVTVAKVMGS